jgi:hypothetical protein
VAGARYGEAGGAWGCWTIGIPREAPITWSAQQGAGAGVYSSYIVTVWPDNLLTPLSHSCGIVRQFSEIYSYRRKRRWWHYTIKEQRTKNKEQKTEHA